MALKRTMTRDQIIEKWDGLTPRERDAWVAEVVSPLVPSVLCFYVLPKYSTDISAAWEIVDISAEWGGMEIGCYGKSSAKIYIVCTYTDTAPHQQAVSITKESAPEAVCLAALIAKLTKFYD